MIKGGKENRSVQQQQQTKMSNSVCEPVGKVTKSPSKYTEKCVDEKQNGYRVLKLSSEAVMKVSSSKNGTCKTDKDMTGLEKHFSKLNVDGHTQDSPKLAVNKSPRNCEEKTKNVASGDNHEKPILMARGSHDKHTTRRTQSDSVLGIGHHQSLKAKQTQARQTWNPDNLQQVTIGYIGDTQLQHNTSQDERHSAPQILFDGFDINTNTNLSEEQSKVYDLLMKLTNEETCQAPPPDNDSLNQNMQIVPELGFEKYGIDEFPLGLDDLSPTLSPGTDQDIDSENSIDNFSTSAPSDTSSQPPSVSSVSTIEDATPLIPETVEEMQEGIYMPDPIRKKGRPRGSRSTSNTSTTSQGRRSKVKKAPVDKNILASPIVPIIGENHLSDKTGPSSGNHKLSGSASVTQILQLEKISPQPTMAAEASTVGGRAQVATKIPNGTNQNSPTALGSKILMCPVQCVSMPLKQNGMVNTQFNSNGRFIQNGQIPQNLLLGQNGNHNNQFVHQNYQAKYSGQLSQGIQSALGDQFRQIKQNGHSNENGLCAVRSQSAHVNQSQSSPVLADFTRNQMSSNSKVQQKPVFVTEVPFSIIQPTMARQRETSYL